MGKTKIIYPSHEEVIGRHLPTNEGVSYSGDLVVYDRKTNPVVIQLNGSSTNDSYVTHMMEVSKEFKGDSLSAIYGKISKWLYKHGIVMIG
jgi:hypothetical protein